MQDPSPSPESLAAALERDGAWLLRIARALTRDAEAASDAVQTTLLRAWERARGGPEAGAARAMRPWLARVVSNTVREDARRAGLRRAREELAARAERTEVEPSHVERLELQRRVVDALDTLPEPYRGTLVLRYFDGLTPRSSVWSD